MKQIQYEFFTPVKLSAMRKLNQPKQTQDKSDLLAHQTILYGSTSFSITGS